MSQLLAKKRVLVFIVAYNAETTIRDVLTRIPRELNDEYDVEILVIDDASQDATFEAGENVKASGSLPFRLCVLTNPDNQGYGGNQKIGYHYAIRNGFDFVALIHGDGQYAPECLPNLLEPLRDGTADAVFGSRMLDRGGALKGGMPLYKLVGNKILSWFENRMLRTDFSEFHSGYRIYSTAALKKIPFDLNTNDFHFDTEIIVQFVIAKLRIRELPIPTYYGDEICRVNGLKYAWNVTKAVLTARAQEMNLFYDRRFDCAPQGSGNSYYEPKRDFESPHKAVLALVARGSRVLDLGCAGGYVGLSLERENGCRVTGVDMFPLDPGVKLDNFVLHDLGQGPPPVRFEDFDYVLMLDVIEHLPRPEAFVDALRDKLKFAPHATLIVSTGNIGFCITRAMLLLGQFNYGKRGILDITHTRLFTFASLRRLFEQGGFKVIETRGIPAPFPLALGPGRLGRFFLRLNRLLIRLMRSMFSYQMLMVVRPQPSLEYLLEKAEHHSVARVEAATERQLVESEAYGNAREARMRSAP
jgi:glycosyltransferase involved in cell wall biosynthesis